MSSSDYLAWHATWVAPIIADLSIGVSISRTHLGALQVNSECKYRLKKDFWFGAITFGAPLRRGQLPSNLPPHFPPLIPNTFPPIDHVEGGDENQPHNSAHNSASTANQDVDAAHLATMQQQFGVFQLVLAQLLARNNPGDPLINLLNPTPQPPAPQQNPKPVQHAPALSESQGQSHIAPAQQPLPDDVTRRLDSLEKLVAEQRGASPSHHAADSIPHQLNTNITLEPYPNASDALMCKIFPSTLRGNARTWYYSLPPKSISSYTKMTYAFATKFSSRRLIGKTTSELMRVKQRDGESLKNYISRFNDAVLEVSSFDQAMGITAVISGLNHDRFRDSLIKHPATTFSEVNDRSLKFITVEEYAMSQNPTPFKNQNPKWRDDNPSRKRMRMAQNRGPMSTSTLRFGRPNSTPPQQSASKRPVKHQNRAQKRKFDDVNWKNQPITFTSADFDTVVTPHNDPLVTSVMINNCEVEGVLTLQVAFGSGHTYVTPSVWFLVVKMASSFNVVIGRPTLTEIRAVVSQSHFCIKFPTPIGIATLQGNQEMARHCCIISVTQPKKGKDQAPEAIPQRISDNQQVMGVEIVDNRSKDEPRAALVEDVKEVLIDDRDPSRKMQIGTRLNSEERVELIAILRANNDVFVWTSADMLGIPNLVSQHKLSTNPLKKPVAQKRRNERLSLLDAYSEYHQVPMAPEDEEKTSFYAGDEIYYYVMMSFGLKNAGATYQKMVTIVFRAQIGRNLEVYVDDIVVKSLKAEDHLADLDETFNNLRKNRIGIEVNPENIKAIAEMEPPKSVKDIQRLTGRVAAPHWFILKSADKCLPFFKIMKSAAQKDESGKQKKFEWNQERQAAFEELKSYLNSPPLLTKAVDGEIFYLYLGISDEAISSVLVREEAKQQKLIAARSSNVLHGAKLRYPIVKKAALAVVTSARKLRPHFQLHPIIVLTDQPLRQILQKPECSGRLINKGSRAGALLIGPDGYRSEHALKFNFDPTNNIAEYEALLLGLQLALELKINAIQVYSDSQLVVNQINSICEVVDPVMVKYVALVVELKCKFQKFCLSKIPRTENEQADSLSKFASDSSLSSRSVFVEVLDKPSFMKPRMIEISTDPDTPSWTDSIISFLRDGIVPEDRSEAMKLRKKASRYTLIDGFLYKRSFSLPLLRCLNPYEAEYALRERYSKCQLFAHLTHQPAEELTNLVAPWPFAQWGLDLLGPFAKGVGGVTHLIVGVDYFTKWVETRPLSCLISKKVEDFVFSSIICRYGILNQIVADNGTQFNYTSFQYFCSSYGIKLQFTSVYHPESNGMVESVNKCILEGIKLRLEQHKAKWADELNNVLWAYRTTNRTATGETPYHLAFGTEVVIPIEIGVPSFWVTHFDEGRNGQLLRENLDLLVEVREEARLRTLVYKQKLANFYNKRVHP
ncbi:hypothetical protein SLEP1_g3623 [Rubroshorea leprosula]|uniref:Uncharacterized protein n=1 Tax=Rubroshorea leprosula TaxID=152421 RepID=A0AAV5HRR7_9ROSI|nr:hypothetical protein SLEP1_g3623 [Rubroshorea leprosula]